MNDAERRRIFGPLRPMAEATLADRNRAKTRARLLVAAAAALIAALLAGSSHWIGI